MAHSDAFLKAKKNQPKEAARRKARLAEIESAVDEALADPENTSRAAIERAVDAALADPDAKRRGRVERAVDEAIADPEGTRRSAIERGVDAAVFAPREESIPETVVTGRRADAFPTGGRQLSDLTVPESTGVGLQDLVAKAPGVASEMLGNTLVNSKIGVEKAAENDKAAQQKVSTRFYTDNEGNSRMDIQGAPTQGEMPGAVDKARQNGVDLRNTLNQGRRAAAFPGTPGAASQPSTPVAAPATQVAQQPARQANRSQYDVVREFGFDVKDPNDIEGIRAALQDPKSRRALMDELGSGVFTRLIDSARARTGSVSEESVIRQVRGARARKVAARFKEVSGFVSGDRSERRLDAQETKQSRLLENQSLKQDYTRASDEEALELFASGAGIEASQVSDAQRTRIFSNRRHQTAKKADAAFTTLRQTNGLGEFATFEEASAMTEQAGIPQTDPRFAALSEMLWKTQRRKVLAAQARDDRAMAAAELSERRFWLSYNQEQRRMAQEGREKINLGDAASMSTTQIISRIDHPDVEQKNIGKVAMRKARAIGKELTTKQKRLGKLEDEIAELEATKLDRTDAGNTSRGEDTKIANKKAEMLRIKLEFDEVAADFNQFIDDPRVSQHVSAEGVPLFIESDEDVIEFKRSQRSQGKPAQAKAATLTSALRQQFPQYNDLSDTDLVDLVKKNKPELIEQFNAQ